MTNKDEPCGLGPAYVWVDPETGTEYEDAIVCPMSDQLGLVGSPFRRIVERRQVKPSSAAETGR